MTPHEILASYDKYFIYASYVYFVVLWPICTYYFFKHQDKTHLDNGEIAAIAIIYTIIGACIAFVVAIIGPMLTVALLPFVAVWFMIKKLLDVTATRSQ